MIDEYAELAEHAGSTMTQQQKIDLVCIIFLESKHYNKALQKWNEKPLHNRTYLSIKQHLNEAYEINQEFSDTTASEAGFTAK